MSNVIGKNLECDSCREMVFLKHISFSAKPNTYEDPPEGWTNIPELGDLCPNCAKKYCIFVTNMFGDRTPTKYERHF